MFSLNDAFIRLRSVRGVLREPHRILTVPSAQFVGLVIEVPVRSNRTEMISLSFAPVSAELVQDAHRIETTGESSDHPRLHSMFTSRKPSVSCR